MPFDFLKPFYVAQRFQVLTPNGWSINIDKPKSDYSETNTPSNIHTFPDYILL